MGLELDKRILDELRELFSCALTDAEAKRAIPRVAKDLAILARVESLLTSIPTKHRLVQGDARRFDDAACDSVGLVLTSPPYWTLKEYASSNGQLGDVTDYGEFVTELARVWKQCHRVLIPGGRLIVVVGDVCRSRREHGRHSVAPLHASIVESCRMIGFDHLAPIIWNKIANAKYEVGGAGGILGKPYEPNAIIKNDIEYVLMFRKPGGYRSPDVATRFLSVIGEADHRIMFQQIWRLTGASTKDHPAPFPLELAERLVRMFSFAGDVVLDPFVGTGTTMVAAAKWGRHSIGLEIDPGYVRYAQRRLERDLRTLVHSLESAVSLAKT